MLLLVPACVLCGCVIKKIMIAIIAYEELSRVSFSEVLGSGIQACNGIVSYRAYSKIPFFEKSAKLRIDTHINALFHSYMVEVYLSSWISICIMPILISGAYLIPLSMYDRILPVDDKVA